MSRFISKIWGVRASNRWGSTTGNRYDEMQERIYLRDMVGPLGFTRRAGISTTAQSVGADDRIYAPYNVYKGKAALSAHPIPPTFTKLDSGALRVGRQGIIMLSFSPALGERKYDWERKQKFALSATEVGSLINLASNGSCEFFHDPSMQTSNAGQVRKNLAVKPHADGSGYFISLNVVNSIQKTNERFTVSVTSAEFAVMRTAFSFALPHIMGWDRLFPPATDTHMSEYKRGGENSTKLDRHLEWGR